jgi:BrxA
MPSDVEGAWMVEAARRRKPREQVRATNSAIYSSKIIKAGALLADTKTLLAHWNGTVPAQANLDRIRRENVFGKTSRSRVEDVLAIFRQRFLGEESVTKALVVLAKKGVPAAALDRILYFHAAQADRLLRDTVIEIVLPLQARGITQIDVLEIQRPLKKWVDAGKTSGKWSEPTIIRIAQGLLSALRDFGVLQGAVKKRIAPAYLPVPAFAYLAFYFKQHHPSGAKLLELPDWKLFFLPREGVERFLFEAHQRELLEYHAAGSVTRLTFPANTLEEYAHVIAERAD